jgi:hypothetical protein
MCTRRFNIGALLTLAMIALSEPAFGQTNASFEVFRRPPETVGSCATDTREGLAAALPHTSHRLVLKSHTPDNSREMMAVVEGSTRGVGYLDMSFVMTSERTGVATNVVVFLDSLDRALESSWTRIEVAYPDTVKSLQNVPALRSMAERSIISHTRRPLTAQEVDSVRELVTYLRRRCPS